MSLDLADARPGAALAGRALAALGRRWRGLPVEIALPGGGVVRLGEVGAAAPARLRVRRWRALGRALVAGDIGFAEGYLAGDWDTRDLAGLLTALVSDFEALRGFALGQPLHRLWQRRLTWLRANTLGGARRNIAAHYDLGNAFYAAWLDAGLTYSSALFERPEEPLETAQARKYAALARALGIQPGHRVLEIGCGWGGFAEFAAREIGAEVTALTISPAQHAHACARLARAGLADRARVRLCDYREVRGRFDRVVSIEMFEAVGERYWPRFFAALRERLAPGGLAGLQVITIADDLFADYRRRQDFIQTHVFPGGMLPSERELLGAARREGLAGATLRRFGADYARTLRLWGERFEAAWPDLRAQGFDARFRRLWRFYLAYCQAGFAAARTDVAHIALVRA